jgi:hypothetical protein
MGSMTAERFARGMTYDEFTASMTRNRDRFVANEEQVKLSKADVDAFRKRPLSAMVLAADWCGDVIANLPILGVIAKEAGDALDVRVFERDANDDLMQQYLNQGQYKSIPVIAFFEPGSWKELGVFIERPDAVTELRARKRLEIFAKHPEFGSPEAPADQLADDVRARLGQELQKMRDETVEFANAEVVRELRAIVEGRATWGGARQRKAESATKTA